nr:MAG TPA: hypothetical protein [Caudoviricetes sp.]
MRFNSTTVSVLRRPQSRFAHARILGRLSHGANQLLTASLSS